MHLTLFLQDLAVIMIVAGIVTVIFHRLKQPVVLGYIIAGIIIGPHTPPFSFIYDPTIIKTLAELGIMFLMFSLGLEFSLRKLFNVGRVAIITAIAEICFMTCLGYGVGRLFSWDSLDSLFLGTMLAISSTTIIIKALNELKMKNESFAQTIFGILIIEDILAIAMLAVLSGIAITGTIHTSDLFMTVGKLIVFLVSALVIGLLTVPAILSYVAQFKSREMLLIIVLGLSFGFSLLVIRMGYSVALGAFLIGAIMGESQEVKKIERLINPLTGMFSAIFFVSIGLLVDFNVIITYIVPVLVITLAVILGKVFICSLAVFLCGRDTRTSMRVGMGLAQIGEFSFIIAALGLSLDVTSSFLYPIIVAVSALTTFTTPYLIKFADPFTAWMVGGDAPAQEKSEAIYQGTMTVAEKPTRHLQLQRCVLQIFINFMLVMGIFIVATHLVLTLKNSLPFVHNLKLEKSFIWSAALIMSIPFLIAIFLKVQVISRAYDSLLREEARQDHISVKCRRFLMKLLPFMTITAILVVIFIISARILPPSLLLIDVFAFASLLTAILWRWFIRLHARLQIAFMNRLEKKDK